MVERQAGTTATLLIGGERVTVGLPAGVVLPKSFALIVAATQPQLTLLPARTDRPAGGNTGAAGLPQGEPDATVLPGRGDSGAARPTIIGNGLAGELPGAANPAGSGVTRSGVAGELARAAASQFVRAPAGEPQLPGAGRPLTSVSLSDAGRILAAILAEAKPEQAGGTSATAPLFGANPPADAAELAVALRSALSESGLFYESHQAEWVQGQRDLSTLKREPQAALPAAGEDGAAKPQPPAETSRGNNAQTAANAPAMAKAADAAADPTQLQLGKDAAAPAAQAAQTTTTAGQAAGDQRLSGPIPGVHPDTVPLIQQQLQVLDSRQLIWQGTLWPGVTVDWRTEEGERQGSGDGSEAPPSWQTELRLQFPRLGSVTAKLQLYPQGLRIGLSALDPGVVEQLQAAQPELVDRIEARGLSVLGSVAGITDK